MYVCVCVCVCTCVCACTSPCVTLCVRMCEYVWCCVYNLSLCMCLCVFDSLYLLSVAEHMGLAGQCFSLSFLSSFTRAGDREG